MTKLIPLQISINLGEPDDTISNVVYEFITNALDASGDNFTTVEVQGLCLIITDQGPGIEIVEFQTIGPLGARDPTKHGSHGMGLKDAVACCVRLCVPISIETVGNTFTFPQQADSPYVHLQVDPNARKKGTKITIPWKDAEKVLAEAQQRFLFLMEPKPPTFKSSNERVEMYKAPPGKGAIMMKGVKKIHLSPPLDYIYNFIDPTSEQKNSISRSHALMPTFFKKHFRSDICKANPMQVFGVPASQPKGLPARASGALPIFPPAPTPVIPRPLIAASAVPRCPVQNEISQDLDVHCMVQDYHVWTLATTERDALQAAAGDIVEFLRTIRGIRVAATSEQGSLAKNTFVPLSSDIDIVVEIVGFCEHEILISNELKRQLRGHGCRMEDSGDRIINFSFKGVEFDLVLIDAAKEDARSKLIHSQRERTENIVAAGNDRLKLQSFIRAVKYWCKRNAIAIKSCSLEMAVLALWSDLSNSTLHPFRDFLHQIEEELNKPNIKDKYDLSEDSIKEVAAKAQATLKLLVLV